jgi:eukaryotic-like serine/threonine-protein kinase
VSLPNQTLDHLRATLDQPDLTGTRYRLISLLGRGGMGAVYRALDTTLDREVALKVIEVPGSSVEPALTEARLLAQLEHPGIVAVHDAGVLPDGQAFCVMRLVTGQRLDEYLGTAHNGLAERFFAFEKLCDAVAFAHSRGVIHRDLKPQNIVIGSFGEVVVLDWGIALMTGPSVADIAGTSHYMAPEQRTGISLDHRVDVYALGVILRAMLPVNAPAPLRAIAEKAASTNPADRYPHVPALAADVRNFQDREPVAAYRESVWEAGVRFTRRNAVLLGLIAAYVLARAALFFLRPH